MSLDSLNDKQREAVLQTEGPLLILAGAGSGKTSTMTHRIAHLVSSGVPEWKILAVTFTNKAANEMKERVEKLVGGETEIWIMTFHAMCLRFLRRDADKLGYQSSFVIYDTTDQKTLVKNIEKESGISDREFKPARILAEISRAKERAEGPADYKKRTAGDFSTFPKAVYEVYTEYEKRLKENNAMDFDDLLLNAYRLFRDFPEALEKYQDRFEYIMVDEYQDTNHLQYELVKMLAQKRRNICVVGDDDQCIYQWRGADIRNILDFEKDFRDAKVIKLEQNYRSVGNILAAAHSVIKHNKGRKAKELWTSREKGDKVTYLKLSDDRSEADAAVRQIEEYHKKGRKYSDFAILYRTNAQSRLFEEALGAAGIPNQVLSGMRYYDRKEIKDVICYLRLIVNPQDDLALARVINEPKRGVGARSFEKLRAFAQVRGQSVMQALLDEDGEMLDTLSNRQYQPVKDMVEAVRFCQAGQADMTVMEIYDTMLTRTGYLEALEEDKSLESESRQENLMEFKNVIQEYQKRAEQPTLADFMADMTLAADVDRFDDTDEKVTLMTLHSAKGLEFPIVFMPGMEDGLFPGARAIDDPELLEEERRLCYVGMTRAKEKLIMTSAQVRMRYGRTEYEKESIFLQEIDPNLMDGEKVYRGRNGGLGISTGSFDGYSKPAYHPFRDALAEAKRATRQAAERSMAGGEISFRNGDHVLHKKFGEGVVIDASETIVTVAFDSVGIKKLAVGAAPLKKL